VSIDSILNQSRIIAPGEFRKDETKGVRVIGFLFPVTLSPFRTGPLETPVGIE
jgi:hypothetical protein